MKRVSVGILAHVDAGKTTLSEGLLYESGMIRSQGRVDLKNAFLDTDDLERARGITIFSKQAVIRYQDLYVTLLDTPGHTDFSAEMERTLWVMDYAILVVSGADGLQGHTRTLWKLLKRYRVPVFIFVNKMDQPGTSEELRMEELQAEFGGGCIRFDTEDRNEWQEQLAVCDDKLLERYLDGEEVTREEIVSLIASRRVFPCYFGSALKLNGVRELLDGLAAFAVQRENGTGFGAKVFKIARDLQGNRLTYVKVTGGTLKVKEVLSQAVAGHSGEQWEEKVNQIRVYSGEKYEAVSEAEAGMVCALTGLTKTAPGDGLGTEQGAELPVLVPVLTYTVKLPEESDPVKMLSIFRVLSEEQPELHVIWQEETASIELKLMGEVQIQVLRSILRDRFGVDADFEAGRIVYRETIADRVEGAGHFEPLRHYAEVHLLLEPGEPGSGLQLQTACSEDLLDRNWQRLILSNLEEQEHPGVLTGSALTDVRITLIAGRAHTKHTEGGDFRQAAFRALRQGLMQAENVLLEPWYSFRLEVPSGLVGRAMTDLQAMHGSFAPPEVGEKRAVLEGSVPVVEVQDYQLAVNAYTKGMGSLSLSFGGYAPCHNAGEVVEAVGYDPDQDVEHPSSSVFCAHGAGYIVPWDQAAELMHIPCGQYGERVDSGYMPDTAARTGSFDTSIDEEQIEEIMNRTFHANERASKRPYKKQRAVPQQVRYRGKPVSGKQYLIVDGYNIVHAWEELKEFLPDNIEGARMRLMDQLCDYQALIGVELILVFDAYKVKGNMGEMFDYHNIHIVYTKEAETADAYIEKLTHEITRNARVTVATSDGLIQLITRGQDCLVWSAADLKMEMARAKESIAQYLQED